MVSKSLSVEDFRKLSPLERYRQPVDQFMQSFLLEHAGKAEPMISYHFGFKDANGKPISEKSEGKALRPSLCLLTVDALGGDWKTAIPAAAAIELFHNFTLIHDDIQDGDNIRHGKPTVWSLWEMGQGINVGDIVSYLSSKALFQLKNYYPTETVLSVQTILTQTGIDVIDGQIRDMDFEKRLDISVDEYLEMISRKTGSLIEASIMIGAELGNVDRTTKKYLGEYGQNIGRAFQLSDDILGIWGEESLTGKKSGADIARRKKSLPVVIAFSVANDAQTRQLHAIYDQTKKELDENDIQKVLTIFSELKVKEKAEEMLTHAFKKANSALDEIDLSWAKNDFNKVTNAFSYRKK